MNCDWEEFEAPDERGWRRVRCKRCGLTSGKTPHPFEIIRSNGCLGENRTNFINIPADLTKDERQALFGESDPSLLGNRIAELTKAIGIPPCGGCEMRKEWLNKANLWIRSKFTSAPSS